MSRKKWGVVAPVLATGLALMAVLLLQPQPSIRRGITAGMFLALAQSFLSTAALAWAWNKKFVYWVWGGGLFFRLFVFAATAFIVFRFTELSLPATLITMVSATTLFLVIESAAFFNNN